MDEAKLRKLLLTVRQGLLLIVGGIEDYCRVGRAITCPRCGYKGKEHESG